MSDLWSCGLVQGIRITEIRQASLLIAKISCEGQHGRLDTCFTSHVDGKTPRSMRDVVWTHLYIVILGNSKVIETSVAFVRSPQGRNLTRCIRGKKELHWCQYCMTWTVVASHFSPFHQQMGPDELHFMWDDSTLPWTYLIWFVLSLTLIQPTESGTWWRLIYVGPDVLRLHSLAYWLVRKKLSFLKLSFPLIRHKLFKEKSFIIPLKTVNCRLLCIEPQLRGTKAQKRE